MSGYTVKISIEDTHPPVWRRIIIPEHISFYDLHEIIQIIFDWQDAHLHDFTFPNSDISVSLPEAATFGKPLSEKNTIIDEFIRDYKWIRYTYDFGDDWRHKIVLEEEVADYDKRYATILKAKGNGFEEDSGGIWYDEEDEDYEEYDKIPEKSFSIQDVASRLEKKQFPYRKNSAAKYERKPSVEDIKQLKDMIREWCNELMNVPPLQTENKSKQPSAMATSIDQVKEFARKMSEPSSKNDDAPKVVYEQLTLPFAEIQNTADTPKSGNGFYKTDSDITMSKMLEKLSYQEAKDYCKYLRLPYQGNQSKKNLIASIIATLFNHPQYYLYVLEEKELHELLHLIQCKAGKLEEQPDIDSVIKGMSLGLADCVCTDKNNVLTVQITFSKEAETILTSLKPAKLKREYKKLYTIADRIRLLLQPYGILDMDTLYEKYCFYWGNELNREDLLRVAYWHCRFCNYVQTADHGAKRKAYIAMADIDMQEILSNLTAYAQDLPYKPIDKEELMQWNHGFCCVYASWEDYELYLREVAHIKNDLIPLIMNKAFSDTVSGCSASYLITESLNMCKPKTSQNFIDLWAISMSITMDTGLAGLKGYSREEYMELKGKLPSRFTPVDPGITTKNIKAKTHLYEMPAQTQEKIYEIMFMPPEDSVSELEKLISGMKVKNEELETLLSSVRNFNSDFSDFLENLSEYAQSDDSSFDSDLLSFLETEEKQEPYRRQAAKIGRNDPCPCGSGKKYKNCCGKNK